MENTYQVYITRSGDGKSFNVALPVFSLEQALGVAYCLDWLWDGYNSGLRNPNVPDAVAYYEGCDVYALNTAKDELFILNENDEWELVNATN